MSQRVSQNVSQREPERVSQKAPESECLGQSGPESELQGLKVSLRVTLGPNLGCQSQPRQWDSENIDFPVVFLRFLSEKAILRLVFEGESHQVL